MQAFKYIITVIIALKSISTIVITVVMVILAGGIISQTLTLIALINWGRALQEREQGRAAFFSPETKKYTYGGKK